LAQAGPFSGTAGALKVRHISLAVVRGIVFLSQKGRAEIPSCDSGYNF